MCTDIAEKTAVSGSGKGPGGWFALDHAYVGYDHPFHAREEHTLNLDFVNEVEGDRVGVELTRESARVLAQRIIETLDRADAYERA